MASGEPYVMTQKAAPGAAPPSLTIGDDDLYWVNTLQEALMSVGFYPGDQETEDMFFGEHTREALLWYQASAHVPETGVADDATWAALRMSGAYTPDSAHVDSSDAAGAYQ